MAEWYTHHKAVSRLSEPCCYLSANFAEVSHTLAKIAMVTIFSFGIVGSLMVLNFVVLHACSEDTHF